VSAFHNFTTDTVAINYQSMF